uniref:Putative secreted protein n=1 Tax=Ixodes ricinus TaxID=34613 RepID=A0A6B0TVS1_IXORI
MVHLRARAEGPALQHQMFGCLLCCSAGDAGGWGPSVISRSPQPGLEGSRACLEKQAAAPGVIVQLLPFDRQLRGRVHSH